MVCFECASGGWLRAGAHDRDISQSLLLNGCDRPRTIDHACNRTHESSATLVISRSPCRTNTYTYQLTIPMQAVPTLELLSMDELNSLDMDDFDDLNLDMYLSPETRAAGFPDGASCRGVRQNLRTHIQRKRRDRGELRDLTALATNFDQDEPQEEQQQMSADEYDKRLRRRLQNRRAARKFREKKKMHAQGIIQDYRRLQVDNNRLQRNVNELQRQKAELEEIVMRHSATCQLVIPPSTLPAALPVASSDFSNFDLSTDMSFLQDLQQFC
ncbi:hypothetical protein LSAT2_029293 [Lamellibrachia satsuma]|nr:hypothetical protein LSAT2_029293 [Lamellibrachia satsuma]